MKVLLVDDSGLARRRVRQMLEVEGYEVIEAADGMVALERYFVDCERFAGDWPLRTAAQERAAA